jgi:ABC-2 type transport system permease protein
MNAPAAVLRSEWTKVRSVRSTIWTLAVAAGLTLAFAILVCSLVSAHWHSMSASDQATFDPTSTSFFGAFFGQLALITFGTLVITSEYSTGMIRTSLTAVPNRGQFYACKVAVTGAVALVVGEITAFATFFVGQALLGSHGASLTDPGVPRGVIGAGVYMAFMVLFALGVATMLRSPMLCLGIMVPLFFLISPILSGVPGAKKVVAYLPDQAGQRFTTVVEGSGYHPYGPWAGLAIMALWVVAVLLGGYAVLARRDA